MNIVELPQNPEVNDEYVIGFVTYRWDGDKWVALTNGDHEGRIQVLESKVEALETSEAGSSNAINFRSFGGGVEKTASENVAAWDAAMAWFDTAGVTTRTLYIPGSVNGATYKIDRYLDMGDRNIKLLGDGSGSTIIDARIPDGVSVSDWVKRERWTPYYDPDNTLTWFYRGALLGGTLERTSLGKPATALSKGDDTFQLETLGQDINIGDVLLLDEQVEYGWGNVHGIYNGEVITNPDNPNEWLFYVRKNTLTGELVEPFTIAKTDILTSRPHSDLRKWRNMDSTVATFNCQGTNPIVPVQPKAYLQNATAGGSWGFANSVSDLDLSWQRSTCLSNRPQYHRAEFVEVRLYNDTVGVVPFKYLRDKYSQDTNVWKVKMANINIKGITVLGIDDRTVGGSTKDVLPAVFMSQVRGTFEDFHVKSATQINWQLYASKDVYITNCEAGQWTYQSPHTNNHYGLQANGENIKVVGGKYHAMKHGIDFGNPFTPNPEGSPINRDCTVYGAEILGNYNFAYALHGNSENITTQNCNIFGGVTFGGRGNRFLDNNIYPNRDGTAYYPSELVDANHIIDGDTLYPITAGGNTSNALIDCGGGGIRGFLGGMEDGGEFIIRNVKAKWGRTSEYYCYLGESISESECASAGGEWIEADPDTGRPAFCWFRNPPETEGECELINGDWRQGGFNLLAITNRGASVDNIDIIIEDCVFGCEGRYNYLVINNNDDNNGRGYKFGNGVPFNSVKIKNSKIDKGGFFIEKQNNINISGVDVSKASYYSLWLQDCTGKVVLEDFNSDLSGRAGIIQLSSDGSKIDELVLDRVSITRPNQFGFGNGITTDSALSITATRNVKIKDTHSEITETGSDSNIVPIRITGADTLKFFGDCSSVKEGVPVGYVSSSATDVLYDKGMNISTFATKAADFTVESGGVYDVGGGVVANLTATNIPNHATALLLDRDREWTATPATIRGTATAKINGVAGDFQLEVAGKRVRLEWSQSDGSWYTEVE